METRKYSKSVIILFLLLVFGFTAVTFVWPERTFSENENRVLASAPEFSWEKLFEGKFMSDYETYITDQFFLRDEWIQLKTLRILEKSSGISMKSIPLIMMTFQNIHL